jgi:hypothetical protein
MATTQPISGQPVRNNGATILNAGNHDGVNITNSLSLSDNAANKYQYGSKVPLSTGEAGSSGNVGTIVPFAGDDFASKPEGFLLRGYTSGQNIMGDADGGISAASDVGLRRPVHRFYGYQRLNITSWDYVTGAATVGGNAGVTVLASGLDGVTGQLADDAANPTNAVPGEFVYRDGSANPIQDEYKARESN